MGFYKELDLFPPYCRVSTDTEKQLSSYETQVAYYVRLYLKAPGLGVCILSIPVQNTPAVRFVETAIPAKRKP